MYQTLFANNLKEYEDRVKIILKDFPLFEIHPWAKRAAIDSNCLAEQSNDAYWDFSDYVHAKQGEISGPNRDMNAAFARLDNAALDSGRKHSVDSHILQSCLKSQPDAQLNASVKEADALGVSSTPTLFVNGDKISGALTESELRQEIQAALRGIEQPAVTAAAHAASQQTGAPSQAKKNTDAGDHAAAPSQAK
jgi:protein-disulfide isomerase